MKNLLASLLVGCFLVFSCQYGYSKLTFNAELINHVIKKNYDAFTKTLNTVDVNLPDSKGRMAIVEAGRVADASFIDALIQFGANVNAKDAATGSTALHFTCQRADIKATRLLLAYGADPNVQDKGGKRPREFTPLKEIYDMILAHDRDGAQAFEDAPGTWVKERTGNDDSTFWSNLRTGESRWDTPPSAAWVRVEVLDQPAHYVNEVTGQEVLKRPKALCWRTIRVDGKLTWYNWVANISQIDVPDEMPIALVHEAQQLVNKRWYNEKTGEFSWEDPLYTTPWRKLSDAQSKEIYYYNILTGESDWETPTDLAWVESKSEEHGDMVYYYNVRTSEAVWEKPHTMAWKLHDFDL